MSITSGFFNSLNGDRKYDARTVASMFTGLIHDGVFSNIGDKFATSPSDVGLSVKVGSGKAWFNHTWTINDSDYLVELESSDLLYSRIDTIVIEVNEEESVRTNSVKVITGIAGSQPVKPELINTTFVHQYPISHITVDPQVTTITADKIEYMVGQDPTPLVTAVNQSMTIDEIVAQWDSEFTTWLSQNKSDFQVWFDSLVDILDENVAATLLNMINAGMNYSVTHVKEGTNHILTGLPTTNGLFTVLFTATADYVSGDMFEGYTAKATGEDTALPDKAFITGDLVSITVDTINKKLGFKLGGGGGVKPKIYVQTTEPTEDIADGAYWIKDSGYGIDTVYVDTIQPDTLPSDGIFVQCSTTYLKFPYVVSKNMTIDSYFRFAQVFRNGVWDDAEVSVRIDGEWVTRGRNNGFLYYSLNTSTASITRCNVSTGQITYKSVATMNPNSVSSGSYLSYGGVKNRAFHRGYEISNTEGAIDTNPANMEFIAPNAKTTSQGGSLYHLIDCYDRGGYVSIRHRDPDTGVIVKIIDTMILWDATANYTRKYAVSYDDVTELYHVMLVKMIARGSAYVSAPIIVHYVCYSHGGIKRQGVSITSALSLAVNYGGESNSIPYLTCEAYDGRIWICFSLYTHLSVSTGTYQLRLAEFNELSQLVTSIINSTASSAYLLGMALSR